jgi:Ion transport protein
VIQFCTYLSVSLEALEATFAILYTIEAFLKICVLGWKTYSESTKNVFDFIVSALSLCSTIIVYYPNDYSDSRLIRLILSLRVLRLLRLLSSIKRFQLIGSIAAEIIPSAQDTILILFFLLYSFAAIGMILYGGMITRDPNNPLSYLVLNTDFSDNSYWANNFNDMLSGMNVSEYELVVRLLAYNFAMLIFRLFFLP